jgi:hypothetical protein
MVFATPKEMDRAYDAERLRWLRRRFMVYAWISIVISGLGLTASVLTIGLLMFSTLLDLPDEPILNTPLFWASEFVTLAIVVGVFIWAIVWVRRHEPDRAQTIRLIYWLFVGTHLLEMAHLFLIGLSNDPDHAIGAGHVQAETSLFISHLFAAIVIPWSVREAVRPLLPLLFVHTIIIALFSSESVWNRVGDLIVLWLIGLPGVTVCWVKQAWFQRKFQFRSFRDAYRYATREVEQARALHESFFPAPIDDGPLRLDYRYQPMSQLGGDYLHARMFHDEHGRPTALLCAVIDVTGHGLSATLTANHLHALLKRQTHSGRLPDPGDLITELNRYMHESFSGLSVFATALCMRLDLDEQRVVWSSAGHPPGLLVGEGHCEPALESTACLLGVIEPEHFEANTMELPVSENVSIIAYTDGASELPLPGGAMLGITGFAQHVGEMSARNRLSCSDLLKSLAAMTTPQRQDDILIARLSLHLDEVPAQAPGQGHGAAETARLHADPATV